MRIRDRAGRVLAVREEEEPRRAQLVGARLRLANGIDGGEDRLADGGGAFGLQRLDGGPRFLFLP